MADKNSIIDEMEAFWPVTPKEKQELHDVEALNILSEAYVRFNAPSEPMLILSREDTTGSTAELLLWLPVSDRFEKATVKDFYTTWYILHKGEFLKLNRSDKFTKIYCTRANYRALSYKLKNAMEIYADDFKRSSNPSTLPLFNVLYSASQTLKDFLPED